jgi:hypothetical protein
MKVKSGKLKVERALEEVPKKNVVEVSQKQANINYYELRATDMLEF